MEGDVFKGTWSTDVVELTKNFLPLTCNGVNNVV
jgi:hypothetical protein